MHFDKIKSALAENKRLLIFIQGSAGTGKTTFAKKEAAYVRSIGKFVWGVQLPGLQRRCMVKRKNILLLTTFLEFR